jgi:pentatricopeptide repeat protein
VRIALLIRHLKSWRKHESVGKNWMCFHIRIKGLCSCNRIPEGVLLLDEVLASGIIPTVITWNIRVRVVVAYGPIQIGHLGMSPLELLMVLSSIPFFYTVQFSFAVLPDFCVIYVFHF